ncbi:MAG: phosphohistidine phosphatase SixA [bacterium]|nr:phosphohistidine phosphatase SixA [Candidatus Kapabacteria bacterium]
MMLYLMRHGIAEDVAPSGGDSERRLTQQGTLRTAMVAKSLKRFGLEFNRIVSSPYVRAHQTAEIVARITDHDQKIILDSRLTPFASFDDVCDLIAENADVETLLLTGHEPSMSAFISGLAADGRLAVDVKKASVTAIELYHTRKPARGSLQWSVTPKLLERLQ